MGGGASLQPTRPTANTIFPRIDEAFVVPFKKKGDVPRRRPRDFASGKPLWQRVGHAVFGRNQPLQGEASIVARYEAHRTVTHAAVHPTRVEAERLIIRSAIVDLPEARRRTTNRIRIVVILAVRSPPELLGPENAICGCIRVHPRVNSSLIGSEYQGQSEGQRGSRRSNSDEAAPKRLTAG